MELLKKAMMQQCRFMLLYTQTYPAAVGLRLQSNNSNMYNDKTLANKTRKLNPNPVKYSSIFKVGKKSKKYFRKYYIIKTPIPHENGTESSHGKNLRKPHKMKNTEGLLNPLSLQGNSQFDPNNISNDSLQNCKLNRHTKYPREKKFEEKVKLLLKETYDATKCKKILKELEIRLR